MRSFFFFFACVVLAACTTTTEGASSNAPPPPAPNECEAEGAMRCDGTRIAMCARIDGRLAFAPAVECPGEQSCRDDACQDPTPRMRTQAASIGKLVDDLSASTAWHLPVDVTDVKARETRAVLKGDATDAPFFGAAWSVLNAFPQGHQALFSNDPSLCGKTIPLQHTSRFGVCGRPSKDGLAILVAKQGNKLGLARGDVVLRAGDDEGEAIYEAAFRRPVCGNTFPAASGRRTSGAASFFGVVPAGTKLTVRAPSGATREITVPAESDAAATDCYEPFARSRALYAEATTRPDGVAVIRLPSFFPFDKTAPTTNAGLQQFIDDYQAEIVRVFDTVKTAPGIVWDVRANGGGITLVGLAIVAGFPSARATNLSYCRYRTRGGALDSQRYAAYAVTPGGPFAYGGKVAVVSDGMAYSAGDYFPYAVRRASDAPLVGAASAGAFGAAGGNLSVSGPPALTAVFDANRCLDAANDAPLEGNPVPPTVAVDYDANDLAAGKDTVLERAVQALGL